MDPSKCFFRYYYICKYFYRYKCDGYQSGATSSISNVTASTFSTGASITFKAGATAVTPTVTGGTTAYDANGNLVVTNATLGMNDIIISDGANQGNGDLSVTGVTLTFNKENLIMIFANKNHFKT